jgi:hypothetical protein
MKQLIINYNGKYVFKETLYLNEDVGVDYIFTDESAEKFKKEIKKFIKKYHSEIAVKNKKDKLILDNYETIELSFKETDKEENTKDFEIADIYFVVDGNAVQFGIDLYAE